MRRIERMQRETRGGMQDSVVKRMHRALQPRRAQRTIE
jgi:hypothetical protein